MRLRVIDREKNLIDMRRTRNFLDQVGSKLVAIASSS